MNKVWIVLFIVSALAAGIEGLVIWGLAEIIDAMRFDIATYLFAIDQEDELMKNKIASMQTTILNYQKRIFGLKETLLKISDPTEHDPHELALNALNEDRS